jgi:hypothetical protein
LIFIESPLFSRLLADYLTDDQYGQLQSHLAVNPDAGDVVKGSGGVRKVRWRASGRGKSGGLRVIYYWALAADQIFMLTLYAKSEKADLTATDLRKIVKLVEEMDND